MKAKRKSDGKVIEVREWRGASDVVYSDLDMNRFYQASDLDFNVAEAEQTESAVIQGWVARNNEPCHGYDLHLFTSKPIRRQIMGDWYGYGETKLDTKLFPSLTWESDPLEVTVTVKPKKQ